MTDSVTSRRAFLRFLAGSPLLSLLPGCADDALDRDAATGDSLELASRITSAVEAINVFDFQTVAQSVLPPAHYGYLATGVDDDSTLRANREGFHEFQLRPKRLVDVSNIDMSVELFGEKWDTPIVLAPAGSQKAFHPQGELAAAKASSAKGHHQILSTVTTTSVEDVNAVRERPVWYQLYPTSSWQIAQALIGRAENAGCPALVLTVDLPVGSNRETLERYIRRDTRDCTACHEAAPPSDDPMSFPTGWLRRKPMFDGLDMSRVNFDTPGYTWEFVRRLKDTTDMKVLVKGIVRGDDAKRCLAAGGDGIIVSNHGGRATASGRATITSLPEVLGAVGGRMPVLVDSGFRRGTDILKALALGATAVCIGRPYLWGLAAFGQDGVERVLDILRAELRIAMQISGVPSVRGIDPSVVTRT
ncbi:MAG: alpha-hydroxy acid oxidase [Gemmatimonadales bacterium]